MSTKLVMQLAVDDTAPADIASLLRVVSQIEQPQLRLLVVCQSSSQAGQVRRRVRENLKRQNVDGVEFRLDRSEQTPFFEVLLPASTFGPELEDEGVEDEQAITSVTPRAPEKAAPQNGRDLPEGNFKVRLVDVRKEEQFGKYFVNLSMEVAEGPHAGRQVEDRVIVWPATARTQHLARALGLESGKVGDAIDRCTGKQFWDRRRETIKRDGSPQIANYYYPLDSPPPPMWQESRSGRITQ